jgi:hypothetical protein
MPSDPPPIVIDNPGVFILPDESEAPIAFLEVYQNTLGQTQQLILRFDRSLRAKLEPNTSVPVRLRGTCDPIQIGKFAEFCWDQDISEPGLRHHHVTRLDQALIRRIDALIQDDVSRQG